MSDYQHETVFIKRAAACLKIKPEPSPQPCLITLRGPEQGSILPLAQGPQVLGRDPDCQLVLGGRGVSRRHLKLTVEGDHVSFEDLGSTNGVYLNNEPVKNGSLSFGDTLSVGPEVLLRLDRPGEEVKQFFRVLRRNATLDSLTGLFNRRAFLRRLNEEREAARRHRYDCCLALVDVDHFKQINDNHGHPTGDAVLVELARRLVQSVRSEDVVGRWGGEEFIIFIRYADLDGARGMMERIRLAVAEKPFETPSGPLNVTLSAGITSLRPEHALTRAIENADEALYEAKNSGRNQVRILDF